MSGTADGEEMTVEDKNELRCVCTSEIELPTARHAEQICIIMGVDQERGAVKKELTTESNVLRIRIQTDTVKLLRTVVSSFYDMLQVSLKCYQEFDDSLLPH